MQTRAELGYEEGSYLVIFSQSGGSQRVLLLQSILVSLRFNCKFKGNVLECQFLKANSLKLIDKYSLVVLKSTISL